VRGSVCACVHVRAYKGGSKSGYLSWVGRVGWVGIFEKWKMIYKNGGVAATVRRGVVSWGWIRVRARDKWRYGLRVRRGSGYGGPRGSWRGRRGASGGSDRRPCPAARRGRQGLHPEGPRGGGIRLLFEPLGKSDHPATPPPPKPPPTPGGGGKVRLRECRKGGKGWRSVFFHPGRIQGRFSRVIVIEKNLL